MKILLPNVSIKVNENVYLKNPENSDLGRKILSSSIDLIDDIGFEKFTFGKLAKLIKTSEASIYRYFDSKHKLLLYFASWYWRWLEFSLVFKLANIESADERLIRTIKFLTQKVEIDDSFLHINEVKLNSIIINEVSKVYLTKDVDKENKDGIYSGYKQLVSRVSDIILEINPNYQYSHMIVSTVVEGAHSQRYFAEHLPRLTDVIEGEDAVAKFYTELVFKAIKIENNK
ncbi:MAG: TetR/AcrR family transcriptional regulator [Flavobacteriales bacterium]|nr:TetR/AcrR family transcriptional regulator [Flavobacteriales bacterium]MDG1439485.1 TetR/AcrR family transcriptional regulator [Flavobacteriales bacterium]MDG1797214.1 TetR/AcrR family transcriptional regulator [Flavobacteriales bacterium]